MLYDLIIGTFDALDIEALQNYNNEFVLEYIPSCEIAIKSTILNTTISILTIHISVLLISIIIMYHVVLYTIPSLFAHEKKIYINSFAYTIAIFVFAVLLTHSL